MAPQLHLGINSCFAAKRWPEPERWVPIVTKELGLDHCQVTLDLFDPGLHPEQTRGYSEELRQCAQLHGLSLHSTFTGLSAYSSNLLLHPSAAQREAAEQWFGRAIALSADLGVKGTGGFLGALSLADANDAARRSILQGSLEQSLGRLAAVAHEQGLEFLLFENMAVQREFGHCIEEAQLLESFGGDHSPPWILCLDLGHPCALQTGTPSDDPLAWIRAPWRNVPVFQIQQANRGGDHHWPFTTEHNTQGLLDATAVVRELRASTWEEVYLFLEIIHSPEYPDGKVLDELKESVEHWRSSLASPHD